MVLGLLYIQKYKKNISKKSSQSYYNSCQCRQLGEIDRSEYNIMEKYLD